MVCCGQFQNFGEMIQFETYFSNALNVIVLSLQRRLVTQVTWGGASVQVEFGLKFAPLLQHHMLIAERHNRVMCSEKSD